MSTYQVPVFFHLVFSDAPIAVVHESEDTDKTIVKIHQTLKSLRRTVARLSRHHLSLYGSAPNSLEFKDLWMYNRKRVLYSLTKHYGLWGFQIENLGTVKQAAGWRGQACRHLVAETWAALISICSQMLHFRSLWHIESVLHLSRILCLFCLKLDQTFSFVFRLNLEETRPSKASHWVQGFSR